MMPSLPHVRSATEGRINGMRTLSHTSFVAAVALGLAATVCTAQPQAKPSTPESEEATRLQVFLDRANFGPGKIDGRYGGFTSKALGLYREAHGLSPVTTPAPEKASATEKNKTDDAKADMKAKEKPADEILSIEEPKPKTERTLPLPELGDMDLKSVGEVFVDYQVTDADTKAVGDMPTKVPAMAEKKWLPYATLGEMVAEKFHCDIDFLKELNPDKIDGLKPGDTVKVPNVVPFDVAGVKELPLLDQLAMNREDADNASDAEQGAGKKAKETDKPKGKNLANNKAGEAYKPAEESRPTVPEAAQLAVEVHTKDNMLRLLENGKLVAAYPVTIGSEETKSPQGEWKVRGIARLPDFRYDSSFLKTGERGDKTYLLPPGPNNLVGVVWIALNKRGIGLHGTGEPDSIGRSASHGCVRLANWDVARLATQVRAGVKVTID